jgi:hypothetical protein
MDGLCEQYAAAIASLHAAARLTEIGVITPPADRCTRRQDIAQISLIQHAFRRSAAGRKRCCRHTPHRTPAASVTAASSSPLATDISTGFSTRMCFPAAAAACTVARCVPGGVSIRTRSRSERDSKSSWLSKTGTPHCCENADRRSADGANPPTIVIRPCACNSSNERICGFTAIPSPIRPTPIGMRLSRWPTFSRRRLVGS